MTLRGLVLLVAAPIAVALGLEVLAGDTPWRGASEAGLGDRAQSSTGTEDPSKPDPAFAWPSAEDSPAREGAPACRPLDGVPASRCGIYHANAFWLPRAYVENATCMCEALGESRPAACVRAFLQDRIARAPQPLIDQGADKKPLDDFAEHPFEYQEYYVRFVEQALGPALYQDLADAYVACCCPSPPPSFAAWKELLVTPIGRCRTAGDFMAWGGFDLCGAAQAGN